jgi:hypothetical protein
MTDGVVPDTVISVHLQIAGETSPWVRLGLPFRERPGGGGRVDVDNCSLIVRPDVARPSLGLGLVIGGHVVADAIDGIDLVEPDPGDPLRTPGDLGALSVDHLVVMTDSLERTSAEVGRVTGQPLKRIREAPGGVRQGFHRLGPGGVIVEIVERADVTTPALWGFVLTVADLDAAIDRADGLIGAAGDAVQPGRRIATVRSSAGLGVPVALLSVG